MPATKKTDRIYLREEETEILQSLLQEWSDKSGKKTRDAFVSGTAVPQIQAVNLKEHGPDVISTNKVAKVQWEKRVSAVYTWFKNHKPFKDRQVFKLERKIPLRRVVGKAKATEIDKLITSQHPDLHRGDKTYPGIYQQAVTEFMQHMSDEDTQEMQDLREEWQAEGPPLDVRLKAAKKYGRKAVVNAHQLLDKEMYISCITLSMVPDLDTGSMGVTCHDYIAELHAVNHGQKFKSFRDWSGPKYTVFMEQIINYANYVKDQRSEEKKEEEVVPAPVLFNSGPGGLPLLPEPVHGARSTEIAKHAQEIIRAYFLRHYQLATRSDSARTPWATIGAAPEHYFDVACLPDGFKFHDPSRMGVTVKTLLTHLRERQELHGVRAFSFHHILHNNVLESAHYPTSAQSVLDSNDPAYEVELKKMEPTKMEEVAKASTTHVSIVIPPIEATRFEPVPSAGNARAPEQSFTADPPPGWSQMPQPHYWHPNFMPAPHPNMPHYPPPFSYNKDPQLMSQWGGHPAWGPPSLPSAEQLVQLPAQLSHGFHPPPTPVEPGIMMPPLFHPPSQFIDPHPIPSGDPPFAFMYPIPFDNRPPINQSVSTPRKKPPPVTPKKTPGKRKRQEAEDTPSKNPTRVSNRTRTPKKIFEIEQ